MSRVVYKEKLTWLKKAATSSFWDDHWKNGAPDSWKTAKLPRFLNHFLSKLPPKSRILEGGCGNAVILKALIDAGFRAEGVDFAKDTINFLSENALPVKLMDVPNLEYPDNTFRGYISLGVIEHFIDEEESIQILKEAIRVTEPGGSIFCSVPFTNSIRKRKLLSTPKHEDIHESDFYQRAYTVKQYKSLIKNLPLRIARITCYDSVKALSGDIEGLGWLKHNRLRHAIRLLDHTVSISKLFGHMIALELVVEK